MALPAPPVRDPVLPTAQSPLAGANGAPTKAWFDFFRALLARAGGDADVAEQIAAILASLATLEDSAIIGVQSVQSLGSFPGTVQVLLRGDEAAPSAGYYYGTGPLGERGFWPAVSLVEYLVDGNGDYLVDRDGNYLVGADISGSLFDLVRTTLSGVYTPTVTNGANVDSSTPGACQWSRVGNTVTVSGSITLDTTAAAATATTFGLSLPVPSAFALAGQCGGTGVGFATTYEPAAISADTANDRAQFDFQSQSTGSRALTFSFTYQVL